MKGDLSEIMLIYNEFVNNQLVETFIEAYGEEADIYGQEFYLSYQSGINIQIALKVNVYDFELTRHIEDETNKALYATQVIYNGARYNIVRHQSLKDDKVLLFCD